MKLRDRKKRAFSVQKQEPKAAEKLGKRGKTQNKKAPSTQLPLLDVPHVDEEPEVIEIKKVKKPRKVVHSYEQASRIVRGKTQRMFLLNVSRQLSTWDASIVIWRSQVLGHSGNTYSVTISNTLSCSCPDYYRQRKPCKHIYFMISQVAQYDEFFDKMNNTLGLTKPKLQELDEALSKRLAPRIKAKQDKKEQNKEQLPDIDLGDEVDCAICFEEFDKTQKLFECQQCKKHFHQPCMDAWKSKNTTCPLCRHDLTFVFERKRDAEVAGLVGIDELDPDHPLKRLQAVSLT